MHSPPSLTPSNEPASEPGPSPPPPSSVPSKSSLMKQKPFKAGPCLKLTPSRLLCFKTSPSPGHSSSSTPSNPLSRAFQNSKGKSATAKSVSRESKTSEKQNAGKRLYLGGLEKERMKEMKIFKFLAERRALEDGILTFKPSINHSKSSQGRLKKKQDLAAKQQILRDKLVGMRSELDMQEMSKCTFRPEINKSSILMDKVKTSDRAAYLFYSAEVKRKLTKENKAKVLGAVDRVLAWKDRKVGKDKVGKVIKEEQVRNCLTDRVRDTSKERKYDKTHFSYKAKYEKKLNKSLKVIKYEEVDALNENFRIY